MHSMPAGNDSDNEQSQYGSQLFGLRYVLNLAIKQAEKYAQDEERNVNDVIGIHDGVVAGWIGCNQSIKYGQKLSKPKNSYKQTLQIGWNEYWDGPHNMRMAQIWQLNLENGEYKPIMRLSS